MSTPPAPARPVVARTGLLCLAGLAAYGAASTALLTTTGAGVPCPFRLATGWSCPLCGSTRMAAALVHGDVATAFAANPGVLVAVGLLALLGLAWTFEVVGGPRLRPPRLLCSAVRRLPASAWWALGLLGTMAAVLARNLG